MRYNGTGIGVTAHNIPRGMMHSVELVVPPPVLTLPPRDAMRRVVSTPCVSLMTTSGGRAALGETILSPESSSPTDAPALPCALASTNDGHGIIAGGAYDDDCAIWKRMESSSAIGSSSDWDEPTASASMDEDDEERTLRRLAQRRMERLRERKRALSLNDAKRHATDARFAIQERMAPRRTSSLQRKPSLRLEMATDRNVFVDKENVPIAPPAVPSAPAMKQAPVRSLRRVDSQPVRPLQERSMNMPYGMAPPSKYTRVASLRRTVSATATHRPSQPTPNWTRTSSARSDTEPVGGAKEDVQDDSGFFEDGDRSQSTSPTSVPRAQNILPAFTQHDREAVELLLGLRSLS